MSLSAAHFEHQGRLAACVSICIERPSQQVLARCKPCTCGSKLFMHLQHAHDKVQRAVPAWAKQLTGYTCMHAKLPPPIFSSSRHTTEWSDQWFLASAGLNTTSIHPLCDDLQQTHEQPGIIPYRKWLTATPAASLYVLKRGGGQGTLMTCSDRPLASGVLTSLSYVRFDTSHCTHPTAVRPSWCTGFYTSMFVIINVWSDLLHSLQWPLLLHLRH